VDENYKDEITLFDNERIEKLLDGEDESTFKTYKQKFDEERLKQKQQNTEMKKKAMEEKFLLQFAKLDRQKNEIESPVKNQKTEFNNAMLILAPS